MKREGLSKGQMETWVVRRKCHYPMILSTKKEAKKKALGFSAGFCIGAHHCMKSLLSGFPSWFLQALSQHTKHSECSFPCAMQTGFLLGKFSNLKVPTPFLMLNPGELSSRGINVMLKIPGTLPPGLFLPARKKKNSAWLTGDCHYSLCVLASAPHYLIVFFLNLLLSLLPLIECLWLPITRRKQYTY